ncbi:MAG: DUF1574 domain-containing protein [Leptospira sp.]|nr:DUF1574 domain-containing protein [Leptospira sp.]NCS95487.1 DUF1574 domain-containing protein [Leptospira sp.]
MKSKIIFFLPILLAMFLFSFDKIFSLEIVKKYTIPWKKIEILFYESKDDLFQVLKTNYPKHKTNNENIALVLGSSRSGEFAYKDIQKVFKQTAAYNFSAPLAGPIFHYYWLEKISNEIPLEFVILEADPIMFSKNSLKYTLNYSLDYEFVFKNSNFLPRKELNPMSAEGKGMSWDEVETWLNKNLFYVYKYPPDPNSIKDNNKEAMWIQDGNLTMVKGYDYKLNFHETVMKANRIEYGAIPNQIFHQGDESFIEKDARNMSKIYFGNKFIPSTTQILFFKKILKLLSDKNIPVIIYWPIVAQPLRDDMEERGLVDQYKNFISKEIDLLKTQNSNFKSYLVDPQNSSKLKCRAFVDSVHLSGACYQELFSLFGDRFRN